MLTACARLRAGGARARELVAQEQSPCPLPLRQLPRRARCRPQNHWQKRHVLRRRRSRRKPTQPMGLAAIMKDVGPRRNDHDHARRARGARAARGHCQAGRRGGIELTWRDRDWPPRPLFACDHSLPAKSSRSARARPGTERNRKRLGFRSKVKKDQLLVTIWSNELSEKEIDFVAGFANLLLEEEELKRLNSVKDRGAVAERAVREAERKSRSARSHSRKASVPCSVGGSATTRSKS